MRAGPPFQERTLNSDLFFIPHLGSVLTTQATVAWIYLGLLGCLTLRVWLSGYLLMLGSDQRGAFLEKTITLSESVGDISILLGVLGTLIGVTMAVAGDTVQATVVQCVGDTFCFKRVYAMYQIQFLTQVGDLIFLPFASRLPDPSCATALDSGEKLTHSVFVFAALFSGYLYHTLHNIHTHD